MLFIDGTWLYSNNPRLSEAYGQPDFRVDFGKLPAVLAEEVSRQMAGVQVDVVRTHLFGSIAHNYDPRDEDAVQRRREFFEMLRDDYHYEVKVFPINFLGRRLRRADREPGDPFEPREKCVDIALATAILYYAAIPHTFDIAVVVLGDQDFKPVLQHVRRLGKRVAIASINGSCAPEYHDRVPIEDEPVKDFDIVWLDSLLHRLELKYERHLLICESPIHKGRREVWTTFHPRRGQKFFCDACRREYAAQRDVPPQVEPSPEVFVEIPHVAPALNGIIKRKIADRGFGFIETEDGQSYFFHLSDLVGGFYFDEVMEGMSVSFEVKRQPTDEKAGAAQGVRRRVPVVPGLPNMDEDYLAEQMPEADRPLVGEVGTPILPLLGQAPTIFPPSEDGDHAMLPEEDEEIG